MERKRMISKIKSKYVLLNLYNFIEDEQFVPKLFFHSKHFQKKLDINYSYSIYLFLMYFLKYMLHVYLKLYENLYIFCLL